MRLREKIWAVNCEVITPWSVNQGQSNFRDKALRKKTLTLIDSRNFRGEAAKKTLTPDNYRIRYADNFNNQKINSFQLNWMITTSLRLIYPVFQRLHGFFPAGR